LFTPDDIDLLSTLVQTQEMDGDNFGMSAEQMKE